MAKVHTRAKRKARSASHIGGVVPYSRVRKKRLKTFKSEELAKKWAKKNKIKSYDLVNLRIGERKDKKFKIVVK